MPADLGKGHKVGCGRILLRTGRRAGMPADLGGGRVG